MKMIPWWAKISVGAAMIGLLLWKYPMMELLTYFFYVCLIPILLFSGIGLIGSGTVDAVQKLMAGKAQDLRDGIDKNIKDLREKAQAQDPGYTPPPVQDAEEIHA